MTEKKTKKTVHGLYPIIDTVCVRVEDIGRVALDILEGGAGRVGVLQLRAKNLCSGDLLIAARTLRRVTLEHKSLFIVNDRVDVALMVDADGVHLGLDDLPGVDARRLLGSGKLIGLSTHNADEAAGAKAAGADYISFGPIFPTPTKTDAHRAQGVEAITRIRRATTLPIVAIGGITRATMPDVLEHGADGVAMISGILRSDNIRSIVAEIVSMIDG